MTEIADAPDWLLALVERPVTEPRPADPDAELDTPFALDEAERWLRLQPLAADGNASDTFYRHACRLKDYGISADAALGLLHRFNPSYDLDDIGARVDNAFKYGQNEPASDVPLPHEAVFEGVEPPAPLIDDGFRKAAWWRERAFPRTEWRWHRRIPDAKPMILTGQAKVGKTTFLLNLAVHVAAGAPFLGEGTRPTDIALLLAEDEYGPVRDNLAAIVQAHKFDPGVLDRLHLRSVLSEPVASGTGHMLARITDDGQVFDTAFMREIVVPYLLTLDRPIWMVDPLAEFVSFNRYADMAPRGLVRWLNSVARLGVTPLITDHPSIASVESGRDIGGSVQMEASFPTVASIKAGEWTGAAVRQREMRFKMNYSRYAPEHEVRFYRTAGSAAFTQDGAPGHTAEDRKIAVYRHIIERLEQGEFTSKTNHGAFGPQELAHWLGLTQTEATAAMSSLLVTRWLQYERGSGGGKQGTVAAHFERGPEGPKLAALIPLPPEATPSANPW